MIASPSAVLPAPTASELRAMPHRERDAVLAAQAERAVELYRPGGELTQFEAFAEEYDGDGDDSPAR